MPEPGMLTEPQAHSACDPVPGYPARRRPAPRHDPFCLKIGRLAVRSLHAELVLFPKPGLVSLVDNGSHSDMTAITFVRSLFALRHYFVRITKAGMEDKPFETLKQLGIEAEQAMLAATGGVNTHRGAIFCLGLLCAAIGWCHAQRITISPAAIRKALMLQWGNALVHHTRCTGQDSHGQRVAARYAASGAREEAALGLPSVFEVALPALDRTLADGRGWTSGQVDVFFALMAHVSDTNVYHRGGTEGALMVRSCARQFIADGGTAQPDWQARAVNCHHRFIRHKLSPGGAADLLAATCLVHWATGSAR